MVHRYDHYGGSHSWTDAAGLRKVHYEKSIRDHARVDKQGGRTRRYQSLAYCVNG